MLILAHSLRDLSFSQLMEVYEEGNVENGRDCWPELSRGQQLLRAEQGFYQYLKEVFFPAPRAVYCIWQEKGRYVSALRLEHYRDGLLLEALETLPWLRRRGFGELLMRAVLDAFPEDKIYSHVNKKNIPSLKLHEKCGFRKELDYAVYIDGSVNNRGCTLVWKKEGT